MSEPHPEYARGYLDAGRQIVASLDQHAQAANNAAPIGETVGIDDLLLVIAHDHRDGDLNPIVAAVKDLAATIGEIRRRIAEEDAKDTPDVRYCPSSEELAVERLHQWIADRAGAAPYVLIEHDSSSDIASDVSAVLVASGIVTADSDAILANAILGALQLWDDAHALAAGQKGGRDADA